MPRILLVEDNEMNRDMLSRRLKRRSFDVDLAVDGQEALDRTRAGNPDLILLDMSLPVKDGWTVAAELKAVALPGRTILTAATVIIATLALLIFGGQTIRGMALTLLIGFCAGMYSSIFVASPVMIWWYKRFGSGKAPVPYAPRSTKAESPKGAEI